MITGRLRLLKTTVNSFLPTLNEINHQPQDPVLPISLLFAASTSTYPPPSTRAASVWRSRSWDAAISSPTKRGWIPGKGEIRNEYMGGVAASKCFHVWLWACRKQTRGLAFVQNHLLTSRHTHARTGESSLHAASLLHCYCTVTVHIKYEWYDLYTSALHSH